MYLLSNQKDYLLHIKLTSAGWYFLDELFCPIATIPHDEITNSIKRQNYELCLHQAASGPCKTVETSWGLEKMTLIKADCCSEVGMINQPTAAMVMTSAEIGHHYYSPSDFPPPIGDDEQRIFFWGLIMFMLMLLLYVWVQLHSLSVVVYVAMAIHFLISSGL